MKRSRASVWMAGILLVVFLFTAISPAAAESADTVRVWVSYQSGRKAEVFQALNKASASVHYDFPQLDAYVVSMPTAALNGILRNPFVVDVEGDPERTPVEPVKINLETLADTKDVNNQTVPWGIDAVQARDVWDPDKDADTEDALATGAGMTVCIIDTGYYAGHDDLKNVEDGVDGMSQVDDDWTRDGYGHGTHVAGTISALNNELGVVGVTPGTVNFHIVKIFDDAGAWVSKARASDLTAAIYECQAGGANVISMSLSGTSDNTKEQEAFDELYAAGILHVAAAGNHELETPGELHYPASYESVIAVAALDSGLEIADFSAQNEPVELAAPGVNVLSTLPYKEINSVTFGEVVYAANHVEYAAYGVVSGDLIDGGLCTAPGSWEGKIVLCKRGEISFLEKVTAAYKGGGIATIIYNNVEEPLYATLGEEPKFSMVAVGLTLSEGEALLANAINQSVDIDSQILKPFSGYEAWAGTSMATPHVSGVAALIWSANPAWSNVQVREAMTATAMDLGEEGRDIAFGFGLVQAADALAYLKELEPPTPSEKQLVVEILSPTHAQQFVNRDTVLISIKVTDGTAPVGGAKVTVTVTDASTQFKPKVYTGLTNAEGLVSFTYRINTVKTGKGQYTIDVVAEKDGYLTDTAQTIFTVY